MSADGAHLGVSASRALGTILGDEPQPTEDECKEQEEFAVWIRSAPHCLEDIEGEDSYGEASRWLARRYLLILEQAPAASSDVAWEVFKTKWPDDAKEAGYMTGFMHGWAWNAALHSLGEPPTSNPALLTIGSYQPSLSRRLCRYVYKVWENRYTWLQIDFS